MKSAFILLAFCLAVTVAENVDCWGSAASCSSTVTRYDRLRVSTLLISPTLAAGTGKVVFSGIHFPNVDGQPPGKLSQLQFRGSFSQVTGCKCPSGNCEALLNNCPNCKSGTCAVTDIKACVDAWFKSVCGDPGTAPPSAQDLVQRGSPSFLQMSFGGQNFLRNTSVSADGVVGMPGWAVLNPNLAQNPDDAKNLRNYAFANPKALTALVQIDNGQFAGAEWNWEKADSRCRSNERPGEVFYKQNLINPCGRSTDNPCINNLLCAVTFDYCLLSMMRANTAANPGIVAPECDLVISLAWQGTDANKRYCASQNQMFSKFNSMGLDNLIQSTLTGANDITSDIEGRLKT